MKRVRCPKCDNYIKFDETKYAAGQQLVFVCPECNKQFGVKLGKVNADEAQNNASQGGGKFCGAIIVIENVFHFKQVIALHMGENVIGRYVKGTKINCPIETCDPRVDTTHCIITVHENKKTGALRFLLRDAPSETGTFVHNTILRNNENVPLEDGSVVTIGATTFILQTTED